MRLTSSLFFGLNGFLLIDVTLEGDDANQIDFVVFHIQPEALYCYTHVQGSAIRYRDEISSITKTALNPFTFDYTYHIVVLKSSCHNIL